MERPVSRAKWLVDGMDCADCAARLEKAVGKVDGVLRAHATFPAGTLSVEYEPGQLDWDKIASTAGALGFRLKGAHQHERAGGHENEAGDESEHDDDHEHEHEHEHGHEHGHNHAHGHVHDRVELSEEHEEEGSLWPVLAGAGGLLAGFLASKAGMTWSWAAYLAGAVCAGYPVARAGVGALMAGAGADINLLTSIAGIGAMALGEWGEAAAVLTLFSVGEYLEERAGDRARKSIRDLMDLSPRTARVKRGNEVLEVPADEVSPGDVVVVLPGERISADGDIVSGESGVNEAPITGESAPVDKGPGDSVFAGSINGEGPLEVLATRTAEDTTLARIVAMVEDAQSKKAASQRMVDSFAKYWTPAMIILSVTVGVVMPLVIRAPLRPWVYRGLTVLIVSCPCSLVISTPVTVVAAIARAARNGILIKGGIHLEDLGRVKAVAFDKTGTITQGRIVVEDVFAEADSAPQGEDEVIRLAAAVESRSEHPLARAIVGEAGRRGIAAREGDHFVSLRGKGAKARVGDSNVHVGSEALLAEADIVVPPEMRERAGALRREGKTVVYVGTGNRTVGLIGLVDAVRDEAAGALTLLGNEGIRVAMLTGDDEQTARAVAARTGVTDVRAGLLPADKQAAIAGMKEERGAVAMVGDGVNDAPSLAAATVGIAMGHGADVALETADVALLKNDLRKVPWSIGLGRTARTLIIENVAFSVALKAAALLLVLGGVLPLWLAVLTDSGAAVAVTLNGLRILGYKNR